MKLFNRPKKDFIRSPCEVCGYLTHAADERGLFFICPVCFWEDDGFHEDPDEPCGGPNYEISVSQAKANFRKFSACSKDMIQHVRKSKSEETPTVYELISPIAEVVDLIERLLDGEESIIDEIENEAFSIITDDNCDKLPEDVQGELDCLHMYKIENLLVEDYIKARKVLKRYLKNCASK